MFTQQMFNAHSEGTLTNHPIFTGTILQNELVSSYPGKTGPVAVTAGLVWLCETVKLLYGLDYSTVFVSNGNVISAFGHAIIT